MPRQAKVSPFASTTIDAECAVILGVVEELRISLSQDGEKAAESLAELLTRAGALIFPFFRKWAEEEPPKVRKTLVQAIAKAADPRDPFRAVFLFSLIEPLLWDDDPLVRKSARRALREKLLHVYPEEALEVLAQWTSDPEQEKKILAASLLPLLPEHMAKRALILLRSLARTEEEKVRRAVLRSLEILKKRAPKAVEEELKRWEVDPLLSSLLFRG